MHNALGTILERQQRVREALACFSQAVSLRPEYAQAKMNRAMALLALGDFEHGWREYEARLSLPGPSSWVGVLAHACRLAASWLVEPGVLAHVNRSLAPCRLSEDRPR